MVKNKHILFHQIDREDGWILNPISFQIPDDIKTFKDAVEHLKHTLRCPEVLKYVRELIGGEDNQITFIDVKWENYRLVYYFNGLCNEAYDENEEDEEPEEEDFEYAFKAEFITNFS